MDELEILIAEFDQVDAIEGGTDQDDDIRWGELCHQLTPMLIKALREARKERDDLIREIKKTSDALSMALDELEGKS